MKRFLRFIAPLVPLLGFFGCGNDSGHAGGPGSETTNGIFASVVLENGAPAAFAGISLRKADFISGDTSGAELPPDFHADSLGAFELENLDSGNYRLTITHSGHVSSIEVRYENVPVVLERINLKLPGRITGKVDLENPEGKPFWVGVYGIDRLARTDSAGNFELRNIPAGNLDAFILSNDRDSVLADTGIAVEASGTSSWFHEAFPDTGKDTLSKDTIVRTLYEDFEDSAAFAAKGWYFSDDSSIATIQFPSDYAWNGVVSDAERGSHVFRGFYTTPANAVSSGYVIFGTRISDGGTDLSGLDSISFYAKGSGSVRVAFERWEANADDNLKAWTSDIPLSDDWKLYTVTPEDFLSPENDTLSTGWESVRKNVTRFHFFGIDGSELALDEITVYGVSF